MLRRVDEAARQPLLLAVLTLAAVTPGCKSADSTAPESEAATAAPTPGPAAATPVAVTVRVTDADGAPVEGAEVEVLANNLPVAASWTASNGHATLTVPGDARVQWVVALKSGAGLDYVSCHPVDGSPVLPPGAPARELTEPIELELDGARTIRVHTVEKGAPRPGVRLSPWILSLPGKLHALNLSGSGIATVTSDGDGVAVFDWVPHECRRDPGGTFLVRDPAWYCPNPPENVFQGEWDLDATVELFRKTTIHGTVTMPDGTPAADIPVQAEGRGDTVHYCRAETRTDADGAYALTVAPMQSYIVTASNDARAAHRTGVVVQGTPVADADLVLSSGVLLNGRVCSADGSPIAGALVLLGQKDPEIPSDFQAKLRDPYWQRFKDVGLVRHTYTDADGRYSFRLSPDSQYLLCALGSEPGSVHEPKPLTVPADASGVITEDFTAGHWTVGLGFDLAPVKVCDDQLLEYLFHPAWTPTAPSESCMQCHRPDRMRPQGVHR